ncbi:ATP-binding protein, partial [Bifidobacterium pseudocatenulatum]|uniref:ATP-binding protein n=1 Tax=Bifidobacterium pseudocatenulatum TaxID=28026 RepID=UPI0034A1ABA9
PTVFKLNADGVQIKCRTRPPQFDEIHLFQVISDSHETRSVICTTNIEFSGWGRVFGDPSMATAIVDRTVHHGRMIRFEGESYRRTHALMG